MVTWICVGVAGGVVAVAGGLFYVACMIAAAQEDQISEEET